MDTKPPAVTALVRRRPYIIGGISFFFVALILLLSTLNSSAQIACSGDATWCHPSQMGNSGSVVEAGKEAETSVVESTTEGSTTDFHTGATPTTPNNDLEGLNLRIMQVGDSITAGHESLGYRVPLAPLLYNSSARGVDYVGSVNWGENMPDKMSNALVALIGAGVDEVVDEAIAAFPVYRPNIILIHLGTNDAVHQTNVSTVSARLLRLADEARKTCPDAVVLLAKLLPASFRDKEIAIVNNGLAEGAKGREGKLMLVDMNQGFKGEDMMDLIHPSEKGYAKMAERWTEGIRWAARKGWLEEPFPLEQKPKRRQRRAKR